MKSYFNTFNRFKKNKTSGFTLIELLVTISLTTIVITIAGSALVNLTSVSSRAEVEAERRKNLTRALDFIADEIRMSNRISAGSSLSILGGATGVLHLTIPSDSTNPNRVYYIGESDSNWQRQNSIFRAIGTYSTSASVSSAEMLVDGISPLTAPASPPSCSGTSVGNNGFYACILDNNRVVDLYLYSKIYDSNGNQKDYGVKTRVFARSQ